MKYFILDGLGQYDEDKYCHLAIKTPEGLSDEGLYLIYGGDLKGIYPKDPFEVKMYLDPGSPLHIRQGDFVSTTNDYVIVSKAVESELKNYQIGNVDFWPFTLINHKGREHSRDYRFVVPINSFDAINEAASDIDRDANGVVIGVDELILDSDKIAEAPDMFKVNDLGVMAFSERLTEKLLENYSNFYFEEVEIE